MLAELPPEYTSDRSLKLGLPRPNDDTSWKVLKFSQINDNSFRLSTCYRLLFKSNITFLEHNSLFACCETHPAGIHVFGELCFPEN